MQQLGIVIRADGTVPIDDGHPHRLVILQALDSMGHDLEHEDGCSHSRGHVCSCNPKIKDWSPENLGQS